MALNLAEGLAEEGGETITTDDPDLEDEESGSTGTSEDLQVSGDSALDNNLIRVTKSDVPFAVNDSPALPRPWLGIPRVAVVYNLNYVWDEDAGEWVKKKAADLIDDFEDQGIGEYGGDTGDFTVTSSNPIEGSFSLEATSSGTSTRIIVTQDGLPTYPDIGSTFSFDIQIRSNADGTTEGGFLYGVTTPETDSTPNGYLANLDNETNTCRIIRVDNGLGTVLDSRSFDFFLGDIITIKVQWDPDGTHILKAVNRDRSATARAVATDTTYTTGTGIGWVSNANQAGHDHALRYDIAERIQADLGG